MGVRRAIAENAGLRPGVSVVAGQVTHAPVAEAVGVPHVPVDEALGALAGVWIVPPRRYRRSRVDLQVHTPRDARWPGDEPKDRDERREVAHEYLSAAQARGIEVVGITEQHDVSWIDELRHAARGLGMHLLPTSGRVRRG